MDQYLLTLFLGAVVGSIYALSAFGLVLTYRTSGVFNFAQGALGMFFAYVFFQVVQGGRMNLIVGVYDQTWELPMGIALPLTLLAAAAFGWGLEAALFRRLRDAGTVVQIVATIGLLIALQGIAGVVWGTATTLTPDSLFSENTFKVYGDFRGSQQQLFTLVIVVALAAGLLAFLRFSPLGIRMRAVVDRPEVSELMGVNTRRVAAFSWGVATAFAALAGILVAPFFGTLDTRTLTFLVIAATAAAVVGKLESLPLTLAGGLGIGMTQLLVQRELPGEWARLLRPSIPFLVLFSVLLLPIRWPASTVTTPLARPPERGTGSPAARARFLAIVGFVLVAPPFVLTGVLEKVLGGDWQQQLALVPPMALIFLSLVVLSGYAGQVSLCQGALAGFGAFIAAHLVVDNDVPFLLAAFIASLITVPLGALLASRATALPPLFLGLATLAFGSVMDEFAFTSQSFANGLTGVGFARPDFLSGDRAYYLAGLAVFGVAALLVRNLRRGATGLALAAMRDTPTGLASLGSSVARLKFVSFCVSAFLAGLGGAWFAGARQLAISTDWFTILSLLFIALAVIGGISRWAGALVGATMFQLSAPIFHQPFFHENIVFKTLFNGQLEHLLPVLFGLGAIGLAQNPHGIIEQVREGPAQQRAKREAKRAARAARAGAATTTVAPRQLGDPVWVDGARLYHRAGCVLTTGKEPKPLSAARARKLDGCPACEPPAPPPAARRRPPPVAAPT